MNIMTIIFEQIASIGHVVPGVVVYLKFHPIFHVWVKWVSEIKSELIVAARGTFTS